uniref:Agmatine deiminase n=1 Tax=Chaetoceros debilis TaxID=122233 RepID=A0A7S3PYK2_9STRA
MSSCGSFSCHMPAEWHLHDACLILYPHNPGVFRSEGISGSGVCGDGDGNGGDINKCNVARAEVRNVARAIQIAGGEDVFLFCNSQEEARTLEELLQKEAGGEDEDKDKAEITNPSTARTCRIIVKVCNSDDSWCRDTGPTFVFAKNINIDDAEKITSAPSLVGIDWNFNAYGGPEEGCYWPCELDRKVAGSMISILNEYYPHENEHEHAHEHEDPVMAPVPVRIQHEKIEDFILEGGSIHTDGEGTILTTKECLLNSNRNPHLSKSQIESILKERLGATKVIWLPLGIACDDDTNGHVDNIATFARPGEVVLSWTDDVNDVNYERFRMAEEALGKECDAKGRKMKVHRLYVPDPMHYTAREVATLEGGGGGDEITALISADDGFKIGVEQEAEACERCEGERLAASYVNYYLANNAVILPQFGDAKYDKLAIATMKKIFPNLDIVGVYSREILLGGGNIHCITQQLPRRHLS